MCLADHPYGKLKPILECVMPSPTSGYINAYFGFLNEEIDTIEIPVGKDNQMKPPPQDRSQTEIFFNRRSRHFPLAAFYAPFSASSELTWELNGYEVTATAEDKRCRTEWFEYEVVLLQDNRPSQSILDAIADLTQDLLGTDDDQIILSIGQSAPTFQQIKINITTVEGAISPMAAFITLFGNTEIYDQYVLDLRALGLTVVTVDTLETGMEKMGVEVGSSTPTPSPPSSSPTPTAPGPSPNTPEAAIPPQPLEPSAAPIDGSHGPNHPQSQPEPIFGEPLFTSSTISNSQISYIAIMLMILFIMV